MNDDEASDMPGMPRWLTFLLVLGIVALLCAPLFAAGSVGTPTVSYMSGGWIRWTVAWTSDASGNVSSNAKDVPKGYIFQGVFVPGTGGTQPTDLYDATLKLTSASGSADILDGGAANLSNAAGVPVQFNPPWYHDAEEQLDLVISNAGNAKTGTVILWIRR